MATFLKLYSGRNEDQQDCWINVNAISMIIEDDDGSLIVKVTDLNSIFTLTGTEADKLCSALKAMSIDLSS
jgi:hypothetical protein